MIKFEYKKIKQGISRSTSKGLEKITNKKIIKKSQKAQQITSKSEKITKKNLKIRKSSTQISQVVSPPSDETKENF